MMKKRLANIILILVFLLGLSIMLYPTVSNYVNTRNQSKAIIDYESAIARLEKADYGKIFAEADDYNEQLRSLAYPLTSFDEIAGYTDKLNIEARGIIGHVKIDKINVNLPIYHGTTDAVLNIGAGHLEGTSLPVGGTSTHSVVTAHRGLPSAKLFTDLDKLEVNDTFEINVLDRKLTYQIEQIETVDPDDTRHLTIAPGEDYCTLFTCTPYGINTQRLLLRGTRIDQSSEPEIYVSSDAYQIDPLIVMSVIFAAILLVLLVVLLVRNRRKTD